MFLTKINDLHSFEIDDLIESLKKIIFNTNDHAKLQGLQFLKTQIE